MTRTDIHRPSMVDPGAYDYCGAFYQGPSHWMTEAYTDERPDDLLADLLGVPSGSVSVMSYIVNGNWRRKGTCDHCGAHFHHGVFFRHRHTGEVIAVGHQCADETMSLPSRAALLRKRATKAHAEGKKAEKIRESAAEWTAANPAVHAHLLEFAHDGDDGWRGNSFYADLLRKLELYGGLSEKQTEAVERNIERDRTFRERRAQEKANALPVPEGRQAIVGKVLSLKERESMYGTVLKMLVQHDSGWKVWGTCPAALADPVSLSLSDEYGGWVWRPTVEVGDTVAFTGTVEVSKDDQSFGFFKRPTKALLVERGKDTTAEADVIWCNLSELPTADRLAAWESLTEEEQSRLS